MRQIARCHGKTRRNVALGEADAGWDARRMRQIARCHGETRRNVACRRSAQRWFGYALESNLDLHSLIRERAFDVVINGHTHKPMVRRLGQLTVVNAGTLFRHHTPGYVVVDFASGDVTWHGLAGSAEEGRLLGTIRVQDVDAG